MTVEFLYGPMNALFSPALSMAPVMGLSVISAAMSLFFTACQKVLVDQGKMKRIKEESARMREEMTRAQKSGNPKKMNNVMQRSLALNQEMMSLTMKPLLLSMPVIMIVLPWVRHTFGTVSAVLPFSLPLVGSSVGWIGLYIIASMPATIIFRKALGVQ